MEHKTIKIEYPVSWMDNELSELEMTKVGLNSVFLDMLHHTDYANDHTRTYTHYLDWFQIG